VEVEKMELSTPVNLQQFYSLTSAFDLGLDAWTRGSEILQGEYGEVDYPFHTKGLIFVQNLQSVCANKFFSHFSLFISVVERMVSA
jgi:hypothetical protein